MPQSPTASEKYAEGGPLLARLEQMLNLFAMVNDELAREVCRVEEL